MGHLLAGHFSHFDNPGKLSLIHETLQVVKIVQ
jgi:hypothetical protein